MDCKTSMKVSLTLLACALPLQLQAQVPQQPGQPQAPPAQAQPAQPQQQLRVAALVNGAPVTQQEVQTNLQQHLRGRQVDPQAVQQVQQQVLDSLIDSRLVEQYVLENGPEMKAEEVEQTQAQFAQQLAAQNQSLEQFLASQGYTQEIFENRIEGSLAWQKFQQAQMNEESLQQHFQQNQERFSSEDFEQAKQEVATSYVSQLWMDIVGKMKPKAEIQVPQAQAPAGQQQAVPGQAPQRVLSP